MEIIIQHLTRGKIGSLKNESVIPDTYAGSPINHGCVSAAGIHPQI